MNETKSCPYCGEEILATAKKCKHCGKWLEKKCPQCGEWINAEAKKCRYCGSWLDTWAKEMYENATKDRRPQQATSTRADVTEAIEEYKENQDAGCLMNIECFALLALFGYVYDWSWWGFIIAAFIGYMLLSFQFLRILYCIGISIIWGLIGIALGPVLIDDSEWDTLSRIITNDYADYWWMGAIFGILSLIFHWPAMKSRFNF